MAVVYYWILPLVQVADPKEEADSEENEAMAVVYIVCVLLFFATSLLILLVKYIRREKESFRLEKFYIEYLTTTYPRWVSVCVSVFLFL